MAKNLLLGTLSALLVAALTWFVMAGHKAGQTPETLLNLPPRPEHAAPAQTSAAVHDAGHEGSVQQADAGAQLLPDAGAFDQGLRADAASVPALQAIEPPAKNKRKSLKSKKKNTHKKKKHKRKKTKKAKKKKGKKKRPRKKKATKIKAKVKWGS